LAGLSRPGGERPTAFFLLPSVFGEDEYWFAIPTPEDFDYLITQSAYSEWFRDIEVSRRLAYVYTLREPVVEPYKDNVLLVGDSAWFAEAEITGSMMCGWKAANSVAIALRDGKVNREGVKDYIEWWQRSYPDFFDYRDLLLLFIFYNGYLTVPEMSYLFGLFKQPLHSTLNPFLVAKLIKTAAQPLMPRIQQEMPSLAEKLGMLEVENIDELLGVEK
jgi:flavin-dependent dehydrogenase